jgi:hypothetical protein
MIIRLSQKLATKIKAGKLDEVALADSPLADWSGHLFSVGRTQYILLANSVSLYTCVMHGKGNATKDDFIRNTITTIRDLTADNGMQLAYRKYIAPHTQSVTFAKPLSRSVIGSMNDLIYHAKGWIQGGLPINEVGYKLNEIPFSALLDSNGRSYANPNEVFTQLIHSQP